MPKLFIHYYADTHATLKSNPGTWKLLRKSFCKDGHTEYLALFSPFNPHSDQHNWKRCKKESLSSNLLQYDVSIGTIMRGGHTAAVLKIWIQPAIGSTLINYKLIWPAGQKRKMFLKSSFGKYSWRTAFTRAAATCENTALALILTVMPSFNRVRLEINGHRCFPLFRFNWWPIIQEVKRKSFPRAPAYICALQITLIQIGCT